MLLRPLRFGTVCSGVDAVSLAWEPLGMQPQFSVENAAFPARVLAHHWPNVPNLGDLNDACGTPWRGRTDVLWASFPCQDFSTAGKQRGMDGMRGALTLSGLRFVDEVDPPVFVFENVKGLLNAPKNAFGQFLGRLCGEELPLVPPGGRWTDAGCVSGPQRTIAWRVLDAQHFRLPQQRERLFVVACSRTSGIDPASILFEAGTSEHAAKQLTRGDAHIAAGAPGCAAAYGVAIRGRKNGQQIEVRGPISNCLRASQGGGDKAFALVWENDAWRVRQLTPTECERLMGLPDGHTDIPGATESQRYYVIGNSLPVPVVKWIGVRIQEAFVE